MCILVSSDYSENPIMVDPVRFGFTDKIVKPFRKADLTALFAEYIKKE